MTNSLLGLLVLCHWHLTKAVIFVFALLVHTLSLAMKQRELAVLNVQLCSQDTGE